ncbi:type VI secretion system baseplate subunit TssK [Geomonas sp. Red875]|uniref:Type VI secretion system baseplate subunit TssK n=2 Tax=Geomesophilobacter sediminis TaxID=2798584 RepID=A0A8J7IN68_9BACT|nr:type VI secretion system baseplate subunit TssK [Geomesophilobacter sediminis]
MKVDRPVFWYQGVFLQPQHFQLQDRGAGAAPIPLLKYGRPHFWGVGGFALDATALDAGVVSVPSGAFLFLDGTYVELPGNAVLPSRPFDPCLLQGKQLLLYLGLRRWNEAGENVTVITWPEEARQAETRFVTRADPEEVTDLHARGPAAQVKRLDHLLKLFWETELDAAAEYLLVPLARLEMAGSVRVTERFIPPSLVLAASEPLSRLVREMRDQMVGRTRQLGAFHKQRGPKTEFGSREMTCLLALRTLNRNIAVLSHFIESGDSVHPWEVYGTLRQAVAELAAFSAGANPVGGAEDATLLPPYDHSDLWGCFSAAQILLTRLLSQITAGPDYVVRLIHDGVYYAADLKPGQLEPGNSYFLAVRSAEESCTVLAALDSVAKLSARDQLPILSSRALPGLRLEPLVNPPPELPRNSRTLYFSIDHQDPQWDLVTKGHNLALHWDRAPEDLEVDLMILSPL